MGKFNELQYKLLDHPSYLPDLTLDLPYLTLDLPDLTLAFPAYLKNMWEAISDYWCYIHRRIMLHSFQNITIGMEFIRRRNVGTNILSLYKKNSELMEKML